MDDTGTVVDLIGGSRAWAGGPRELHKRGLRVLKYSAVEALGRVLEETPDQLLEVIYVTGRTAQRRVQTQELSAEESDRLLRVATLTRRAIDVFGGEAKARTWLKLANRSLEGRRPLDLLGSELESLEVDAALTRIEFGDFA